MPDHEQKPPTFSTKPVKVVSPTQEPNTLPISGFAPAPVETEAMPLPEAPAATATQVELFTFEFQRQGVLYRAEITSSPATGLDLVLRKSVNGKWITSSSRMREGILGAFALNLALKQLAGDASGT